jgi:hypothetical protein
MSAGRSPASRRPAKAESAPRSARRTLRIPWAAALQASSSTATSCSCPRTAAASEPPAGARELADVSQPALGRANRLTSTGAAVPNCANSSSSGSVSRKTPLPCETRCTRTSWRSASSSTASRQRGPSVLGISTRYCAPSGNRFAESGSSCRSPRGSPIPARTSRTLIELAATGDTRLLTVAESHGRDAV